MASNNNSKDKKKKLTEEEKEAIKIEKQNELMRDQFRRESKFTELSNDRGSKQHEILCKNFTFDRLKTELTATIQTLNRFLDKSDHTVGIIENHRRHAEEQHQRLFEFHSHIIDRIYSLFNLFQKSLEKMYEDARDRLVADFYEASVNQEKFQYIRRRYYENFMHASVSLLKHRLSQFSERHIKRSVEINAWSVEHRDQLMEQKIIRERIYCHEIEEILKFFIKKLWPKSRLEDYDKTRRREVKVYKEIDKIKEKISGSCKIIESLKMKVDEAQYKKLSCTTELKSEYSYLQKLLNLYEKKLLDEEKRDRAKMKHLVVVAENAKQKIFQVLVQGCRIKCAVKICKKYEKLDDDTKSFTSFQSSQNIFHSNNLLEEAINQFLKKFTKIEADNENLKTLKNQLISDNFNTRKLIDQYKHEKALEKNYQLLKLNLSPNIGSAHLIAHESYQIKDQIRRRKLYQKHLKFFLKNQK